MIRRRTAVASAILLAVGGSALGSGVLRTGGAGWQEIAWPFPQDAWPAGRAFRCRAASCGGDAEVYLRPKLGFCANCATGVTDDAEVDGVADLDMISDDFVGQGPGQQVAAGGLSGRMRTYVVRFRHGVDQPAAGFAVSRPRQCDLFIVVSVGPAAATPQSRSAVAALLETDPVGGWARRQLGAPQ